MATERSTTICLQDELWSLLACGGKQSFKGRRSIRHVNLASELCSGGYTWPHSINMFHTIIQIAADMSRNGWDIPLLVAHCCPDNLACGNLKTTHHRHHHRRRRRPFRLLRKVWKPCGVSHETLSGCSLAYLYDVSAKNSACSGSCGDRQHGARCFCRPRLLLSAIH